MYVTMKIKIRVKKVKTQLVLLDVNETTCFGLFGHHQVCKSSKRLNIVCVWQMLRSHHLANKLDMRHKLRVSIYLALTPTGTII